MDRQIIEQELVANVASQKRAREQLDDANTRVSEALAVLEDNRLRALASETPVAGMEVIKAQIQADALLSDRERLEEALDEVDQAQSRLFDLLPGPANTRPVA
jgi:outer membrane PBP1 activator LpoA protein